MITSPAIDDFSTYKRRPCDVWAGADETQKVERHASEAARLMNVLAGLAVTTLPVFAPHAGWAATFADYSVLGRGMLAPNFSALSPNAALPAPLPFIEAHYERLAYRDLEDGWDDISSVGVSRSAADLALKFLALLPSDLKSPEASASGDGTVDWYWRNGRHAATVTFYPNGRVAYFSMTDAGRVKDSFTFSGSIPDELVESLRQL
jgi:hypothetical protein